VFQASGIPPSYADYWRAEAIRTIARNRIYLGCAISLKTTSGIHVRQAHQRPLPALVEQADYEDGDRLSVTPIRRDRKEWWIQHCPDLQDVIVDAVVRERAEQTMNEADDRWTEGRGENYLKRQSAKRERHRQSPYILRDVLLTRDGDFPMRGWVNGGKRCYGVSANVQGNPKAAHLTGVVPALPLETAVIQVLRSVFLESLDIQSMISSAVAKHLKEQKLAGASETVLEREAQSLSRKIHRLIDANEGVADAADEAQLAAWKERRRQISLQLNCLRRDSSAVTPEAIVKSVAGTLCMPDDTLDGESYFRLRNVVNTWCFDVHFEQESRELTFSVGLPSIGDLSAIGEAGAGAPPMAFAYSNSIRGADRLSGPALQFRCWSPHADLPSKMRWPRTWGYEIERVNPKPRRRPR
jgi:hypothetical protein